MNRAAINGTTVHETTVHGTTVHGTTVNGTTVTSPIASDIYRVTVVGPRRRVDIALPAQVTFADLFPAVARYSGLDQGDLMREPEGWVLQRLGHPPFSLSATPASEDLHDGELLYLRPKSVEMPALSADDIADEIASVHDGAGRWTPADTQRLALGAGAAALLAGAVLLARSGPHWTLPAVLAAGVMVVLLAASAAASRAAGSTPVAAMLGYASLPYAFIAGVAGVAATVRGLPGATGAPGSAGDVLGNQLRDAGSLGAAAGFALVLLAAAVAAACVVQGARVFFGVGVAALFGLGAAAIVRADPSATAAGAAALVVVPALALTPLVPAVAFRIAGVSMPPIPASAEDLRNDELTAPQADVRPRAVVADRAVTSAALGTGLVGAGAEIALGSGHGTLVTLTAVVLACVMLLQSRLFRGRAQRLCLLVPGYAGLAWAALASGHLVAVPALVAGAGLVAGVGAWLPGHRPSPFWGRAADITDTIGTISLLPLALGVAGLLGYLHGLSG